MGGEAQIADNLGGRNASRLERLCCAAEHRCVLNKTVPSRDNTERDFVLA
jgi:hypothetical protein